MTLGRAGATSATGSAVEFGSGKTSAIGFENTAALALDSGTIALWFKSPSVTGVQTLVSKGVSGSGSANPFAIRIDNGRIAVQIGSGFVMTDVVVKAGDWAHLAVSFGKDGLKIHLNGQVMKSVDYTGGIAGNGDQLVLGAQAKQQGSYVWSASARCWTWVNTTAYTDGYAGLMDDLAVFKGALSTADIAALAQRGATALAAQLQGRNGPDGVLTISGIEEVRFADGVRAIVAGAGAETPAPLTPAGIRSLDTGETLVVIGPQGARLPLSGSWSALGTETIGSQTYQRQDFFGIQLLVASTVTVVPDRVATAVKPVSYWSFDQAEGQMIRDQSGSSRNAVLKNGANLEKPGAPDGKAGDAALDLDACKSDFATIAHDPALAIASGTISLWVNPDSTCGTQTLFSKQAPGGGAGGMAIQLVGDRLEFRMTGTDRDYVVSTGSLFRACSWSHLAVTFGTGGMELWVNGQRVGTNAFAGGLANNTAAALVGASTTLTTTVAYQAKSSTGILGAIGSVCGPFNPFVTYVPVYTTTQTYTNFFDGKIDELAVYDQRLTATQIRQLMQRTPSGVTPLPTADDLLLLAAAE